MDKHKEIEAELDALKAQSSEYSQAQAALSQQSRSASKELNELLSKRPELVAGVALGQRDQADIIQTRARIRELRDEIDECSAGHDWLEQRKKEIKTELDKRFKEPDVYRQILREYEDFKERFPMKYQTALQDRNAPRGAVRSLFGNLRFMAKRINRTDEAEQFLSGFEIPEG